MTSVVEVVRVPSGTWAAWEDTFVAAVLSGCRALWITRWLGHVPVCKDSLADYHEGLFTGML